MILQTKKRIKLLVLVSVGFFMLIVCLNSRERLASANLDDTFEKISAYRTWKRVTREPIKGASLASLSDPKIQNRPPIDKIVPAAPQQVILDAGDMGG